MIPWRAVQRVLLGMIVVRSFWSAPRFLTWRVFIYERVDVQDIFCSGDSQVPHFPLLQIGIMFSAYAVDEGAFFLPE